MITMANESTETFKVKDGLSLTVDIKKPEAFQVGVSPVLVHFHGGYLVRVSCFLLVSASSKMT
jgi:hypothetical protein